ncbi:MAG: Ldh family oxidoreductase [Protaetiibacter sp.]
MVPLFTAVGVAESDAREVVEALVDADARGIGSHGLMLAPIYLTRIRSGSVSTSATATVVTDAGAIAVLDAGGMLGLISAREATDLAIAKAREFGVGLVTVRGAFHFGAAGSHARRAAEQGMLGLAAANTRPLLPAPGGARAVVGNNPLAFAAPTDADPIVVDLAMSEVALGRIRGAAAVGRAIPETWATDAHGVPTTDPQAAIDGMLLPMGGHKGFGLAITVELLTSVLAGGAVTSDVQGLYADPAVPYDSTHTVLVIDPAAFTGADETRARATVLAERVRSSPAVDAEHPVRVPGDRSARTAADAAAAGIPLDPTTWRALREIADELGVPWLLPSTEKDDDHAR